VDSAKVCIVGMGYVGLTLAVVAADVGLRVHGLEIRDDIREGLQRQKSHFFENGLDEMLARAAKRGGLSFSKTLPADFDADYYVVTVGTPLGGDGRARLDMVEAVVDDIAARMKPGACVIMRSTVKIGTTRSLVRPILERAGVKFHLAFCPERTVEGQALTELRELPQIVGADAIEDANVAASLFRNFTSTIQIVSSLDTAEMVKLVDNVSRDVNFAFANEVAMLCDQFGVSATEVIRTANNDYHRTNVALPGPVAGPCLSKDPYILMQSLSPAAQQADLAAITRAGRMTNERLVEYCREQVREALAARGAKASPAAVALLGLAFKGRPETGDLRGSMAGPILEAMRAEYPRAQFRGYDPVARTDEVLEMGLAPCASIEEATAGAGVALILNNHRVFERTDLAAIAGGMASPGIIYDFWSQFRPDKLHLPAGIAYMSFGNRSLSRLSA
jgi:UDP-N-acetyl-D-mannosaminuronic acid dehydrogenase